MEFTQLIKVVITGLQAADAAVAADAQRRGISKEQAWAGAHAAMLIQFEQTVGGLAAFADPMGWRAAAWA